MNCNGLPAGCGRRPGRGAWPHRGLGVWFGCWGRISIHAVMKFLTTWGEVESAVALMSVPRGKRIAEGGISRGRWCGPHYTSGQSCRCSADRGHQYSRLHVGIPFLLDASKPRFLIGIDVMQRHAGTVLQFSRLLTSFCQTSPTGAEVLAPSHGPTLHACATSRPSTPSCDWWRL